MIILFLSPLFAAQPQDLSNAMSIPSTDIVTQTLSADPLATANPTSLGVIYPTDGSDMAELYTGAVGIAPESGTDLGAYGDAGEEEEKRLFQGVRASLLSLCSPRGL